MTLTSNLVAQGLLMKIQVDFMSFNRDSTLDYLMIGGDIGRGTATLNS